MEFETRIIKTKFIHELQEDSSAGKNSDSLLHSRITSSSSTFSPKKSKRSIEKRVITVSIKDVEGSRQKGEIMSNPPSDSWAWRKYGQKPIKGSPYPRGYYKCSSSKGCPARKQVEKNREDPNLLVLAYYWEHNHPCPPPRNYNNHQFNKNNQTTPDHQVTSTTTTNSEDLDDEEQEQEQEQEQEHDVAQKLITQSSSEQNECNKNIISNSGNDDYGLWFSDYDYGTYSSSTGLEIPIFGFEDKLLMSNCTDDLIRDDDEDEAIFADLGELPECSTVFRQRTIEIEEERRRRQSLTLPYCGTTL